MVQGSPYVIMMMVYSDFEHLPKLLDQRKRLRNKNSKSMKG